MHIGIGASPTRVAIGASAPEGQPGTLQKGREGKGALGGFGHSEFREEERPAKQVRMSHHLLPVASPVPEAVAEICVEIRTGLSRSRSVSRRAGPEQVLLSHCGLEWASVPGCPALPLSPSSPVGSWSPLPSASPITSPSPCFLLLGCWHRKVTRSREVPTDCGKPGGM